MRALGTQLDLPQHGSRYAALAAYAVALVLTLLLVVPPLAQDDPADRAVQRAAIERPTSLPAVIPGWAWKMNVWHETNGRERGRRPHGAPNPLPQWYWDWHAWRVGLRGPSS